MQTIQYNAYIDTLQGAFEMKLQKNITNYNDIQRNSNDDI